MKLTPVLRSPPVFHFWRDFGAGKKRRINYYKLWWNAWRRTIARTPIVDHTLSMDKLPPGSRLLNAEDLMEGHIDLMPDEILERKKQPVIYDHPWPFNVKLDETKSQQPAYTYSLGTRFFMPREDGLTLTNTLLETDAMEARPPFEPNEEQLAMAIRQYEWSTEGDSVLVRQPKKRAWPQINLKPAAKFGIVKERKEMNVLNSLNDISQTLLARNCHEQGETSKLDRLLDRRTIAFPHCQVALKRDDKLINLELNVETMLIGSSPLALEEPDPRATVDRPLVDISPRSWRSLLEQTRRYRPNWSPPLPDGLFPQTILLASRIKRDQRNPDEMLARCLVHAYGLASQYSRPLLIQAVGLEVEPELRFHFVRFQRNEPAGLSGVKNQAWYSGPIENVGQALRFFLDFQARDN